MHKHYTIIFILAYDNHKEPFKQVDKVQVPSVFEIKESNIEKHDLTTAFSSSSLGSALAGSNSSSADSNESTNLHHELQFTTTATPSALSVTKENIPTKIESKPILSAPSLDELVRAPSNTPMHSTAMQQDDLSQDDQRLSAEAQQLAQDIVQQSVHSPLDSHSSASDHDVTTMTIEAEVHTHETTLQEMSTVDEQLVNVLGSASSEKDITPTKRGTIAETQSEVSISNKSSSAIVVDMTQLHIN